CLRVSIGTTISLPMIYYYEPIRTYRDALRMLIEQIIQPESLLASLLNEASAEIVPEPFDDRASGNLTSLYHIQPGNYGIGEGPKEPRAIDGLCRLTENGMR